VTVRTRTRYVEATEWLSPTNIDNTGTQNVSAGLTNWLAATGGPGDLFRLRPGSYWIPQGIRIGKSLRFDLNGATLFTGTVLGDTDPDLAGSLLLYPALWDDWDEPDDFTNRRCCINVQATNVHIYSSVPTARVQGAARKVAFRGTPGFADLSTGCRYYGATFEEQHAIRLGGGSTSTPKVKDVLIDLNNISLEFVLGDGVLINDDSERITIIGKNLGEPFLGGTPSATDDNFLTGYPDQGATVNGIPEDPPTATWTISSTVYPGIHHTGRHGIATGFTITDVLIDGVSIWRTGRAIIDLEPAGTLDVINNVTVRNCETGIHALLWFAAAGPRGINNLTLQDNICYETISIDTRNAGATARHTNWKLLGNRNHGQTVNRVDVMELDRIDGLEIKNNFNLVNSSALGVDLGDSTGVVFDPAETVQFPDLPPAYLARCAGTANPATVTH
jgi:hypothetical protein